MTIAFEDMNWGDINPDNRLFFYERMDSGIWNSKDESYDSLFPKFIQQKGQICEQRFSKL